MEFRVAGSELHLRGKVEGYEFALLKDALAEHPSIDTVVFRGSPGGDACPEPPASPRLSRTPPAPSSETHLAAPHCCAIARAFLRSPPSK